MTIMYYERYAIIPATVLFFFTFRSEYIHFIFSTPIILFAFSFHLIFWVVQEYIGFFTIGSVSNLSFLNAFSSMVYLPVYLLIGIVINNDSPNIFILIALTLLGIAIFIKPSHHEENKRKIFEHGIIFIIFITLFRTILDAINCSLNRLVLQNLDTVLFVVALYAFLSLLPANIYFLLKKIPEKEKNIANKNKYLVYSVPVLWFLASIPEGYGFLHVPIYTMISIGSITFLIDIFSDLRNKRIKINNQTIIFITLVLVSMIFSVVSLN